MFYSATPLYLWMIPSVWRIRPAIILGKDPYPEQYMTKTLPEDTPPGPQLPKPVWYPRSRLRWYIVQAPHATAYFLLFAATC